MMTATRMNCATGSRTALRPRQSFGACETIGALAKYERGEITPDDFIDYEGEVEVRIGIRKQRNWGDFNLIEITVRRPPTGSSVCGAWRPNEKAPIPEIGARGVKRGLL